ncbi:MAG: pilus assembly protein PilP [Pseudomonadales bacterium]|jgi:type IV pilus assembly protein PilO|nr:pilus assembly protein PilP [Pseudomonadales bacterium]
MNFLQHYEELLHFDWHELNDLDTLGNWPAALKTLVLLLAFGLCLGLGNTVLLRGTRADLERSLTETTTLRDELRAKQNLAATLNSERAKLHVSEAALGALLHQLPARSALPAVLDAVAEAARRYGLALDALTLGEEQPHEFYLEQPFSLTLRGDYHALGLFMGELAAWPLFVAPRDFSLTPEGTLLRAQLDVSLYQTTQDAQAAALPNLLDNTPTLYTAAALRDPFAPDSPASTSANAPDAERPREALEAFDLSELRMSGTLERQGQRWALIGDPSGKVTRVGLGARLGRDQGRIVRISRERVELIEVVQEGATWRERDNSLSLPLINGTQRIKR